jgi:glycosyltransferase involved in cell wall biosynthesis
MNVAKPNYVWYVYPELKHVSFSSIGDWHYQLLKKHFKVEPIDELAFPTIAPIGYPLVLLQPYFYVMGKVGKKVARKIDKYRGIIGVDVADSDRLSKYGVELTEYAKALIVPSNFSRNAYINSGVKTDVHVLPHGVTNEWIETPPQPPKLFTHLAKLKQEKGCKLLLSYQTHSPIRKGLDVLLCLYKLLLKERNDVLLAVKTASGVGYFPETIERVGGVLEHHMDGKVIIKWLNENEKMELYDLCDLYILASRGGAFEVPALEALTRNLPVIGARGGSWDDYLPDWALVPSKKSGQVLPDNPYHIGCGVEMLLDKAVDRACEILDNLEEYRAKVREYVTHVIKPNFTWDKIGERLKSIVEKYLS